MNSRHIAWIATVLLLVSISVSVVGFRMLIGNQKLLTEQFFQDEFLDVRRTMTVLENVEAGQDLATARAMLESRAFTSLTRLQPNRHQLPERYLSELDSVVARYAAYRQRNPEEFANEPDWYLARIDE